MQTDGKEVEAAIRRGRRTVCVLFPCEVRILLRRWGGNRPVAEVMQLERRRQFVAWLRALARR